MKNVKIGLLWLLGPILSLLIILLLFGITNTMLPKTEDFEQIVGIINFILGSIGILATITLPFGIVIGIFYLLKQAGAKKWILGITFFTLIILAISIKIAVTESTELQPIAVTPTIKEVPPAIQDSPPTKEIQPTIKEVPPAIKEVQEQNIYESEELGLSFTYPNNWGEITSDTENGHFVLKSGGKIFLSADNYPYDGPDRGFGWTDLPVYIKDQEFINNFCENPIFPKNLRECAIVQNENGITYAKTMEEMHTEGGLLGTAHNYYIFNPNSDLSGIVIS